MASPFPANCDGDRVKLVTTQLTQVIELVQDMERQLKDKDIQLKEANERNELLKRLLSEANRRIEGLEKEVNQLRKNQTSCNEIATDNDGENEKSSNLADGDYEIDSDNDVEFAHRVTTETAFQANPLIKEITDYFPPKSDTHSSSAPSSLLSTTPRKKQIETNSPVRKKADRKQLNGYACKQCQHYYGDNLNEAQIKERLNKCSRHRANNSPPTSPDHFWETDFPSSQECLERGIMLKDEKPVKRAPKRNKSKDKYKLK